MKTKRTIIKTATRKNKKKDCSKKIEQPFNLYSRHFLTKKCDGFMTFEPKKEYDVIVMNPPFNKGQAVRHVTKAIQIAKRCVVAITDIGVTFRNDKPTVEFRELVKSHGGTIEPVEEGAFKESGTMVKTCIITVRK